MTGIPEALSGTIVHLTLDYVIEHRGPIQKQVSALKRRISKGKLAVLVIGAPGTGKSTLGRLFSAKPEPGTGLANPSSSYNVSLGKEEGAIEGYWFTQVTILPGQKSAREKNRAFRDAMTAIRNGKIDGIIHVCSAGLHSVYSGNVKFPYQFVNGVSFSLSNPEIRARLDAEIDVLAELSQHIKDALPRKKIWMISVINKQDIWYQSRKKALTHYDHGKYNSLIEDIGSTRGKDGFEHDYCALCLAVENYFDGTGSVIFRTSNGYDARMQIDTIFRFMSLLANRCRIDMAVRKG